MGGADRLMTHRWGAPIPGCYGTYSVVMGLLFQGCYGAPIPGCYGTEPLYVAMGDLLRCYFPLRCYGGCCYGGVRAPLRCYHGSHSVVISPTPLLWGLLLWGLRAPLRCYDVRPPRVGGQHPVTSYLLRPRPARLCCPLSAGVRRKRARPYTPLY